MGEGVTLELIEEYVIMGEHRFKLRLRGTNIVFNVSANSLDEAVSKAINMIKGLKIIH